MNTTPDYRLSLCKKKKKKMASPNHERLQHPHKQRKCATDQHRRKQRKLAADQYQHKQQKPAADQHLEGAARDECNTRLEATSAKLPLPLCVPPCCKCVYRHTTRSDSTCSGIKPHWRSKAKRRQGNSNFAGRSNTAKQVQN